MARINMTIVKMSEKGQIAIPKCIREEAGLDKGDELIILLKGKKILIEKTEKIAKGIEDDFKDIYLLGQKSLKEVWDNHSDAYWDKYYKKNKCKLNKKK